MMRIHIFWIFLSFYLLFNQGGKQLHAQDARTDSLRSFLATNPSSSDHFSILIELANSYNRYDLEQAMAYAIEAQELATNPGERAKALLVRGRTYANLAELDSALFYFRRARSAFVATNDSTGLGDAYLKLQYAHLYMGNGDSALYHSLAALTLFERLSEKKGITAALAKVAESLSSQSKFEEAIPFALRGLSVAESIQDTFGITDALASAASNYLMLAQYDSALYYQNRNYQIFEAMNSPLDMAISLNARGNIYKLSGQHSLAVQDYETGIRLAKPAGFPGLDRALTSNLGDVRIRMGEFELGLSAMREVLELDRNLGNLRDQPETYRHLASAHAGLGNYDSAYFYRIQFDQLKDSLFTEESDARIAEMQTKYETEKMADRNEALEQQRKQQQSLLWVALVALLAIGGIAFLLYRSNQRRKQVNTLLTVQKTEIEFKNQQNETLLKEIHHRVKNNLQVISSLLRLQTSHIEDDTVREMVAEGEHRVKSMALIHQKLYQRDNLSGIEMKGYLHTLGQSLLDTVGAKGKEIKLDVQMEELEVDVDTAVPLGLIANELLTNSLKYAFPEQNAGKISLSLAMNKAGLLQLTVADDGVGQGEESTIGKGSSFGSKLIQLLCMQMDGEMSVETEKGRITKVAVREFELLTN